MKKSFQFLFFIFLYYCLIGAVTINPPKVHAGPIDWNTTYNINLRGVTHHTINSTYVGDTVGFVVYTPPGYESSTKKYPVIYFLHGISGNEWNYIDWMQDNGGVTQTVNLISIAEKSQTAPYIAVFPNGGAGSGYADYVENMIIKEIIPYVDSHFRTINTRNGRGIEGFSMGGNGSAKLAFRHTDMFVSLVSISGGNADEYFIENLTAIKLSKLAIRYVAGSNESYGQQGYNALIPLLKSAGIAYEEQIVQNVGHNIYQIEQSAGLNNVKFHLKAMSLNPTGSVTPIKLGDADGDRDVDGVDYAMWRSHYNQNVTGALNGDFNNSGKVDDADFTVWRTNYGL